MTSTFERKQQMVKVALRERELGIKFWTGRLFEDSRKTGRPRRWKLRSHSRYGGAERRAPLRFQGASSKR